MEREPGMSPPVSSPSSTDEARTAGKRRPWGLITSLALLLLLFLAYTLEAFTLPWAAHNGYIGAGQFPRIIGCAGVILTALALVLSFRSGAKGEAGEAVPAERLRLGHPAVAITLASVLLVALLEVLGGLIAGVAFLCVCLTILNRGRPVTNGVIALGFMGLSYVLMHTLLNAPWPTGVLGI